MENTQVTITGKVTVVVYDKDGNVKEKSENHNIIVNAGDSLIADALQNTPVRQRINNSNGYIPVGTGWTGVLPKTNTWVNVQTGISQALDATYPKLEAAWGTEAIPNVDSNIVNYRTTYSAGTLNVNGINEAAIVSAAESGASTSCLAYAQITPAVNVTTLDTFVISWSVTLLGS